ncbi:681_t:CDS:2, partial [Gigaspora rosea]
YSQYMNNCVKTVNYDDDNQMPPISYSKSYSFTKDFKNIQNNRPSNKNMFGKQSHKSADDFSQIASKEKNLCNILKNVE